MSPYLRSKFYGRGIVGVIAACMPLAAQQNDIPPKPVTAEQVQMLLDRLASDEVRIKELENKLAGQQHVNAADQTVDVKTLERGAQTAAAPAPAAPASPTPAPVVASSSPLGTASADDMSSPHDHMIELPGGGPALKIRGFFDMDLGLGSDANPLIFPEAAYGVSAHNTFQAGEFDLFMSSKLS
jgi:hypothetical protein